VSAGAGTLSSSFFVTLAMNNLHLGECLSREIRTTPTHSQLVLNRQSAFPTITIPKNALILTASEILSADHPKAAPSS